MTKVELKKILKPLIKECIREVILEENGIIPHLLKECTKGLMGTNTFPISSEVKEKNNTKDSIFVAQERSKEDILKTKERILESIKRTAPKMSTFNINGMNVFEGTVPLRENKSFEEQSLASSMTGIVPGSEGAKIDFLLNSEIGNFWKKDMKKILKK